ncbi:MAG: metallophosphoesterase [Fibrobacteria bacterium]
MTLGLFLFVFSTLSAWSLMHWYVFQNFAAIGVSRAFLIPVLWALALSFPILRLLTLKWRNSLTRILNWIAACWMGSVFVLSFWFLISSGVRRLAGLLGFAGLAADAGLWIASTAFAVAGMIGWGLLKAFRGPKEVRYAIDRSARYRRGESVRIVQISDVHLGLTLGTEFLRKLVERINGLRPDLVFITGDFIDPEFPSDVEAAAILSKLVPSQGTYAVSGNHEFYAGLPRFLNLMAAAGIPVLANEVRATPSGLQIAGIHDQSANRFPHLGVACDLGKALRDINHGSPSFLLAHQPKELEPAHESRVDLVFCGHTHAGQVFPFLAVVRLAFRYVAGKYALGKETDLIVNTGTGFWGPPMRIGTDSQIVVVDFRY